MHNLDKQKTASSCKTLVVILTNKIKYILIIFLVTSFAYGQKDSAKKIKESINIFYGQKLLSHKTFDGAYNDLEKYNLGKPITYIGIGGAARAYIDRGKLDHNGSWFYTQILPQNIKVNDSITTNITGFNLAFSSFGFDLVPNLKNFDLLLGVGANTGRLRLYGNSYTNQKNPYFSPKLSLIPRVIIGKICLQINIDYEFDISKKNWRKMNTSDSPKINLPQTSNTGLTILTSIGYVIKERKRTK